MIERPIIIESLDQQFADLHEKSCRLIVSTPNDLLYHDPRTTKNETASHSVGAYVLRSAGVVEQTFGGITSNLWDDPFEWTLPENLSTPSRVIDYLNEVEEIRRRAFVSFRLDADLLKSIATPAEDMRPIISVLVDTLARASIYQGRALALAEGFPISA